MADTFDVTVITCNAAGGKPARESDPRVLGAVLASYEPDFIVLQELTVCRCGDVTCLDTLGTLNSFVGLAKDGSGRRYKALYRASVDTQRHRVNPNKIMPDGRGPKWQREPFVGHQFAAQGNGFLVHPRWKTGRLQVVPLFTPPKFQGDRDTEPRELLLLRVSRRDDPTVCLRMACTHLTTTVREHKDADELKDARRMRQEQAAKAARALSPIIESGERVLLGGDFNSESESAELAPLRDLRALVPATKRCPDHHKDLGTHIRRSRFIDLIWAGPRQQVKVLECRLLVGDTLEAATDHRPVLARLRFTL